MAKQAVEKTSEYRNYGGITGLVNRGVYGNLLFIYRRKAQYQKY